MSFFFFTEPTKLNIQNQSQAFGAIDENNFRLNNMFSSNSTDAPKAFALCDGLILVQEIGNTGVLNIVLKPIVQPDLSLPKIDFIIYKGIKKDSLIDGNEMVADKTQNDLTCIAHESAQDWFGMSGMLMPNDEPKANSFLGLAYSSNATDQDLLVNDTDFLNKIFYKSDGFPLPYVNGGNHVGDFNNSTDFGIMIVFEKIGHQLSFKEAREKDSILTFNPLPSSPTNAQKFKRKHEKEDILAFMDSASFFGSFYTLGINVYNGSGFDFIKENEIYDQILIKHFNKNKIYFDIRNEYDDSFNYYENYDNTIRWNLDGTNTLIDIEYYRNHEWPILVIDNSEFSVITGNEKILRLSLPNRDNEFPLVYLKRAYREDLGLEKLPEATERFLTPIAIENVTLSNYVRLNQNLIIPQSNNQVFSNYFQIKYIKRMRVENDSIYSPDNPPPQVGYALYKHVYLENLFPIFDLYIPFSNSDYTNLKIYYDVTHIDKLLVKEISQLDIVGDFTLRDYTASIGIARDPDYVTFISFPYMYNNNMNLNNDVLPLSSMESGNNSPFLIELNSIISSIDLVRSEFIDDGNPIGFLKFINNSSFPNSSFSTSNYSFNDVIIISLTTQQFDQLSNLKTANFNENYKVYLGIKNINPIEFGGSTYFSFELTLRGLVSQNGSMEIHVRDTGIILYSDAHILGIDSGHFFPVAKAYIQEDYGERNGGHKGIDIETTSDAETAGSPVYAARGGTVRKIIKATNNGIIDGYLKENGGADKDPAGVRVFIEGDNGYFYYYFHLAPGSNDHLNKGDRVNIGVQIGEIGLSGQGFEINPNWTQYHLHFEIWNGENYKTDKINPYTVFPELALLPYDFQRNH